MFLCILHSAELSLVHTVLTLSRKSKLQEVVYFWSMTGLPPPPSSSLPRSLFCLTWCHLLTVVPSLFPHGLRSATGCCRPTLERDMGKFTNCSSMPRETKIGNSHWTLCIIAFVKAHIFFPSACHHCKEACYANLPRTLNQSCICATEFLDFTGVKHSDSVGTNHLVSHVTHTL